MRMRFGVDEDEAFHECAARLVGGFAAWLERNELVAEPSSAELLLQYKWLEADGDLATWPLEHVETFLDGWCPRVMAEYRLPLRLVPLSAAMFVEYLDESGLLAARSPRPSQIRRLCGRYADDYDELEARPVHPVLDEFGAPPDPVRIPGAADRAASAAAAAVLADARALASWCGPSGRALTRAGNLRVADARELARRLGTDDLVDLARIDRASRLPELGWVLETAVRAGAVHRDGARLVAGTRFAELDDTSAHEDLVLAAREAGVLTVLGERRLPGDGDGPSFGDLLDAPDPRTDLDLDTDLDADTDTDTEETALDLLAAELVRAADDPGPDVEDHGFPEPVDDATPVFLALLRHPVDGVAVDDLADLLDLVLGWPGGIAPELTGILADRLRRLGLVGAPEDPGDTGDTGERLVLTPGGIACALLALSAEGLEFPTRPDPAVASAAEIVDLAGEVAPDEWRHDIDVWHAAQPDPARAAAAFVTTALAPGTPLVVVLAATGVAAEHFGDDVVDDLLAGHLDGPHRGQVARRLVARGRLDPGTLEPELLACAAVDVVAVTIDTIERAEWPTLFAREFPPGTAEAVAQLWQLDHPRLGEVLDELGGLHPDAAVARAARAALHRWRDRTGGGR